MGWPCPWRGGGPFTALVLALSPLLMPAVAAAAPQAAPCERPRATRAVTGSGAGSGLSGGGGISAGAGPAAPPLPAQTGATSEPSAAGADYRARLRPTPFGWARLDRWCVWVEPAAAEGPAQLWEGRWLEAVERALGQWQRLLPITRTPDAEAAQVRIQRRRPPLEWDAAGRARASHGRARRAVVEVERGGGWILEPRVQVLISPGPRQEATAATALHELGHAFGLWGHSDEPGDAMAAVPGARPVLELSPRDIATLRWLYGQPSRFGRPLETPALPGNPPAERNP